MATKLNPQTTWVDPSGDTLVTPTVAVVNRDANAVTTLLNAVTATGAGASVQSRSKNRTFQATVAGTGAVSATVKVQVSNDNVNWIDLGTITLSGTTSATDGFASNAPWAYVRGNVTAISGTGAAVTLAMGV